MSEWLQLIPDYLIILIIVFIIIPTFVSVLLRLLLYNHLLKSAQDVRDYAQEYDREMSKLLERYENQPEMLKREKTDLLEILSNKRPKIAKIVEKRYQEALKNLDHVNTPALIDGIYSQEEFRFFSLSLSCEKWEYFTRIIPNLLLSFGLLGTFLGITFNLYNISQSLNNVSQNLETNTSQSSQVTGDTDLGKLIDELKPSLEGMGIAFITSLIALICSSILIFINLQYNTSIAKYQLLHSLEDYLDNIYKPITQGDTRLDRAVNRMVDQQEYFLLKFHEKVGKVMEDTIGKEVQKMTEANQEAQNLVIMICESVMDTSTTLSAGATTFQKSVNSWRDQVNKMIKLVAQFEKDAIKVTEGAEIFETASKLIEKSKFSENLERVTQDLAITQKNFADATTQLSDNIDSLIEGNTKANELAERVYSQLDEASTNLQDSALGFIEASEKIEQSQFADKLVESTTKLEETYRQFAESTSTFNNASESVKTTIKILNTAISELTQFSQQIETLNQKSSDLIQSSEQRFTSELEVFQSLQENINSLVNTVAGLTQSSEQRFTSELEVFQSLQENINSLVNTVAGLTQSSERRFTDELHIFQTLQNHINSLVTTVDETTSENSSVLQSLATQLKDTLNQYSILIQASENQFNQQIAAWLGVQRNLEQLINDFTQRSTDLIEGNQQKFTDEIEMIKQHFSLIQTTKKQLEQQIQMSQQTQIALNKLISTFTEKSIFNELNSLKSEVVKISNKTQSVNINEQVRQINERLQALIKIMGSR